MNKKLELQLKQQIKNYIYYNYNLLFVNYFGLEKKQITANKY